MPRPDSLRSIVDQVNGITVRVGVISSTDGSATTNLTTAVAFALEPKSRYVLQCDASDLAFTPSPLATTETDITPVSADPAKDIVFKAGQPFAVSLAPGQKVFSLTSVGGVAFSCKVLKLS